MKTIILEATIWNMERISSYWKPRFMSWKGISKIQFDQIDQKEYIDKTHIICGRISKTSYLGTYLNNHLI